MSLGVSQICRSESAHWCCGRLQNMSRIPVSSLLDSEDESKEKVSTSESPSRQNKRVRWTLLEDEDLKRLVEKHGEGNWDALATMMTTQRTGRQLRARWKNRLDPKLDRRPWTEEEDMLLLKGKDQLGLSWSALTQQFQGRCDNDLKNRYFQLVRSPRGKRPRQTLTDDEHKLSKEAGPSGVAKRRDG